MAKKSTRTVFLEGPAGAGKTTYATGQMLGLIAKGASPDRILVLVPQVTLGRPYQLALHNADLAGGSINIVTAATIAKQAVETFWPLVAEPMGFADPSQEPTFLNIETAQYFMARFVSPVFEEQRFGSVSVSKPRAISQILDNLNRAALMRFPVDEIAIRLSAAWGNERESTRPAIYKLAEELAATFRAHCLRHNLLDFSLVMEAFQGHLMHNPAFTDFLSQRFDHLIADNIEEDMPIAHDLIAWLLPNLKSALLVYDSDSGYRNFLGADPDLAYALHVRCKEHLEWADSRVMTPDLAALSYAFNRSVGPNFDPNLEPPEGEPAKAFEYKLNRFYPQMVDWVVEKVVGLITSGVAPRQIAILAPYLNDSLRFALTARIKAKADEYGLNIPTLSHRPSRSLRDEPTTRTLLTLAALAHPEWDVRPHNEDVADAISQAIAEIDPVRARLLVEIVYRRKADQMTLGSFARINTDMQERITFLMGERFEQLREWIERYKEQTAESGAMPLDHFLRRLFGEVLSQPGYGYHADLEAGRIAAQLIQSAQGFRRALYPDDAQDWSAAGREFVRLIDERMLPALFAQSWQDEDSDAVFLAPTYTFLLRNRFVDYQFWLDVGSGSWGERLEQPLTHPYVLRREYPPDMVWTDDMENEAQRTALYRIAVGLTRRCRHKIFLGITDLGESGFEQRGPMLRVLQQILRGRAEATVEDESE